jgi:hypothetical protein
MGELCGIPPRTSSIGGTMPKEHPISPQERAAIAAEIARSKPPRTSDDVRAELAIAEAEYASADRAEDNYDGNNPGKLTRLQSDTREAKARVQKLKRELGLEE